MSTSNEPQTRHRCNILTLDGGGVRGLSSLLILRALMQYVNATVQNECEPGDLYKDLEPREVFDFAAGTSTGGLIAIMLGKLGMSLQDCIQAYYDLSKNIFSKKHFIGKITRGLAPTKYSGTRLEQCTKALIQTKSMDENLSMFSCEASDKIACAVLCREHYNQSKYSDIKPGAVPICSLECPKQIVCLVSEAARATSAAPTFFPAQRIGDRYFVDGGMEYNNPSEAIFFHLTEYARVAASRRLSESQRAGAPQAARHGDLDFSRVRFVNLGTGTKSHDLPPRQRDRLAQAIPSVIRMAVFLKRTLTEFAVNSEIVAQHMQNLAFVSTNGSFDIQYERFSADNGVCYIKMDNHQALDRIESLTNEYLIKSTVQSDLKKIGEAIGRDYMQRQGWRKQLAGHASGTAAANKHTPSDDNIVPQPEVAAEADF